MPSFPREELEEMLRRWIAANNAAGKAGDWSKMSSFYTDDALYSWNNGPNHEFVARGRERIHEWAFGLEMAGLDHWVYPYVRTLIDDRKGEIIGIWRQIAPSQDPKTGRAYEIAGTGGSWFRYAGDFKWCWQRDWFDLGNAANVFFAMLENDQLTDTMKKRLEAGASQPGWVKRSEFDWYETIADREG
jgi:hypothetical protein